jgi:hypothetical protein
MAQTLQNKIFADELPADWGTHLDPKEREVSSLAMAKMAFVDSGRLRGYFDRSGERRRFSPTEEDIKNRDFAVATKARVEDAIRTSLGDTVVWLIWGVMAAVFGMGVARDKPPMHVRQ